MMNRFFLFFIALFFLTVSPALAADATRSYSGCSEIFEENNTFTVWIQAPSCEVTLTVSTDESLNVLFQNLDSYAAEVTATGVDEVVTRSETGVTVSFDLVAGKSTTILIQPWDYDPDDDDFWFVATSESQNQNVGQLNSIFANILDQVDILDPAFFTISGDIIKGNEDPEIHKAEYDLYSDAFQKFGGSIYTIMGDHDARQNPEEYYETYFGSRDYSFVYGNTRVIGFNTTEDLYDEGRLTDDQLVWLEEELRASTEDNLIILMQHPIVPPEWANSVGIVEDQRLQIAQLFIDYGVDMVLNGDVHGFSDMTLTSEDIPGLSGSLWQMTVGGGGGKFKTYFDTDHFYLLFHISGTEISYEFIDYTTFDVDLDYSASNDATAASQTITVQNNGIRTVPYMRIPIYLKASDDIYASLADGTYVEIQNKEVIGDVVRGYIEVTDFEEDMSVTYEVKERNKILQNIDNIVLKSGLVRYNVLPNANNTETNLSIIEGTRRTTVSITEWDLDTQKYRWTEIANKKNAKTQFQLTGLESSREYYVYVNGKLKKRKMTDSSGTLVFTNKQKKKKRKYRVVVAPRIAKTIGTLPGAEGGPNLRLYADDAELSGTFFAYDEDLSHGYDSLWADFDGDGKQELVTVPTAGQIAHVRSFEQGGKEKGSFFPYGESFTAGVSLAAGDLDGDGDDEIIVSPLGDRKATVRIYQYSDSGKWKQWDSFRAFGKAYTGGATVATGDLDGDGDDEIIVGQKEKDARVWVYQWKSKKQQAKKWGVKRIFTGDNQDDGVTVATGDLDFDGKDEVVAGSLRGTADVRVYNFASKKGKLNLRSRSDVIGSGYTGGVNLAVGDINSNSKEEIIVSQRATEKAIGKVVIVRMPKKGNALSVIDRFRPFGKNVGSGVVTALSDIDGDSKQELVTALDTVGGSVKVFDWRKSGMKKRDTFSVYGASFNTGIALTR